MKRTLLAAASVVVLGASAGLAPTATADETDLALPKPTGKYPVGKTTVHLEDSERADPWVPEEKRQLMTSVWYPAAEAAGKPAQYMTPQESKLFVELINAEDDVPGDIFSTVQTQSYVDAKPARGEDRQLVVLSPGFSFPRATLTGLAEELASRGYVVAAVGHNYEAPITMPDGETGECVACRSENYERAVTTRAADMDFLLDTMEDATGFSAAGFDADRVAMGGHSLGGAATFAAMSDDERIAAGFNLDGTFFAPEGAEYHVDRPFMMIGAAEHGLPGADETWDKAWDNMSDWKRWMTVKGTGHSSLTDLSWLTEQYGIPSEGMSGQRCTEVARDYVAGFIDTQLGMRPDPVVEGPTPQNPEVEFHNP